MSNDHKDHEEEYMEATKEEAKHRSPEEKQGIQEPRVTGYKPLQLGMIIFVILVLVIVGFGFGTDWFGIFD
ncbi:hypothetical protein B481_2606 [Planococcus halocryophilus Or1]|uniref:Uncharacterized protein n=1 Tax=Planococcus halocryophilus TaxID=1215089 RepID=A0A1C7DSS8_9BACL|nr:hypothetical protein [Planococcus halocryophilus]ANU14243.1 hypothetical protein BBI08_10365 [Planococcus halocryophilus]EMF46030.1 hypothetical protein B481_2606 [Planococcus halocryophilus Or1]